MAKRSEIIKENCPACGCGLIIDLDNDSIIADGSSAKVPEKPKGDENNIVENPGADDAAGSEKDKPGSAASQPVETATDEGTDSDKNIESDSDDSKNKEESNESELGLGNW